MVRRDNAGALASASGGWSPAGASPASVSAGVPSSRPQARDESGAAQAECQEPLRREPARGPQHDVKPAASADSRSESRADHFAAKVTSAAPQSGGIRAAGLGGVWGAPAKGLSVALDERDRKTQEHCDRVSGLSLELGRQCGLSERELHLLHAASVLHDIGKIGIPDEVLKKPEKLDEAELEIMKTHAVRSERIVLAAGLEDGAAVALAVRHHHERFDGRGYPDGLAGEAIPILARIVAIADAYDAMARGRSYSSPKNHAQIIDELRGLEGRQHDAYLLSKFYGLIERSRFRAGS
jgi:HD-GYP domain-containing protein (c-di-GMP phosphodiesterase class II)